MTVITCYVWGRIIVFESDGVSWSEIDRHGEEWVSTTPSSLIDVSYIIPLAFHGDIFLE